jgi:signal transduction histidine kinase
MPVVPAKLESSTAIEPLSSAIGLTMRATLLIGFAFTAGLWLFAGYRLTQRMVAVDAQGTAINDRYMKAQELLSNVRAGILLGSVIVRDALLDPDPATVGAYLVRFDEAFAVADNALKQYVPVVNSPSEDRGVEALRREIDAFHAAMLKVFDSDVRSWPDTRRAILKEKVVPQRDIVLRVSDQVQALNRLAFVQQRTETVDLYRVAERRAWQRLGWALAASLAVGLVIMLYAGRLERRVKRQRIRDLEITSDLHRLSGRLVTAQEDERRTLARELHDDVGQALTALRVELTMMQRAPDFPARLQESIEGARNIAEETLRTIRDLSHLLHPALLDDLGLIPALEWQLKTYSARHGIATHLVHERTAGRLAQELETAVYRIVQEALTNVAKHARATTCHVYLQGLAHSVLVTIEDNGSGFDPVDAGRGLGLISIRERATQLGGTVRIESAPGRGTRLLLELPARFRVDESAGLAVSGNDVEADGELTNSAR